MLSVYCTGSQPPKCSLLLSPLSPLYSLHPLHLPSALVTTILLPGSKSLFALFVLLLQKKYAVTCEITPLLELNLYTPCNFTTKRFFQNNKHPGTTWEESFHRETNSGSKAVIGKMQWLKEVYVYQHFYFHKMNHKKKSAVFIK